MPSGVAEAEAVADSRNFEGGLSFSKCAMRERKSFEEDEPGQDGAENEDAAARRAERAFFSEITIYGAELNIKSKLNWRHLDLQVEAVETDNVS